LGGWWRARGNEGYDPLTSKPRGEWRGRFGYRTARIFSYSYVVDMTMHCGGKSAKPISSRVIRFKKKWEADVHVDWKRFLDFYLYRR
jgi:hypothetical protein